MSGTVFAQYFSGNTVSGDFFRLMVGDLLGSGIGREVYELPGDPSKVVKFETNSGSFQNVLEWETWDRVFGTAEAKWLAPCIKISACGTVLIMERTEPISSSFKMPKHVPAFLSDFKRTNYGLLKGRLVCHDYGTNLAIRRGANKAMRALGKSLSL